METILLVEDEENIAYPLRLNLEKEGYKVVLCDNGKTAMELIDAHSFDMLLLETVLPEHSGYEVCEYFRKKNNYTPIIFLSFKNDQASRVRGLQAGADDFISKPFDLDELFLKVARLMFKGKKINRQTILYFGDCWINLNTLEAKGANGEYIRMSKLEVDLAELLILNENAPLKREVLYEKLWGYDSDNMPNSRTLDNFIVYLRKYFEKDAGSPQHFIAVRGIGYMFKK